MDEWGKKKVLMFVKTYPTPSAKYQETVCTAGVTDNGEWIRLYPVQFRYLREDQKFEKYTWIEIETKRNRGDKRPESFKANVDTLKIIRKLDPKRDLEERKQHILPLCSPSLDYIQNRYDENNFSLGIFKPKQVHDLIITEADKEWTPKQQAILDQTSLLDTESKSLEKVPWDFSYVFSCNDDKCIKHHKLKITDWEIYQAFRHFKRYYRSEHEALIKLKEKYLGFFKDPKRDSYLIVGTVNRWPTFIVIGVFTHLLNDLKNKNSDQLSLI